MTGVGGWRHDSYALKHCDVGGVTTTGTHGVCLKRVNKSPLRTSLSLSPLR
jgi:hypothetical protein